MFERNSSCDAIRLILENFPVSLVARIHQLHRELQSLQFGNSKFKMAACRVQVAVMTTLSSSHSKGRSTSTSTRAVIVPPDKQQRVVMPSVSSNVSSSVQSQLILMRHGESMWNDLKLFTGDVDIPLTEKGVMEALAGGRAVSEIDFDVVFTSRLVRAKQTALIAMTQSKFKRVPVLVRGGFYGKGKTGDANRIRLRDAAAKALETASCRMVPVYADPALNERCYGDLQGLNKTAAAAEFGEETVTRWRRSYDTRPPNGESLQDTYTRSVGFFKATIEPRLKEGCNVFLVAHGNVLRCLISHLAGYSDLEMLRLQILTALPYSYTYNGIEFVECCILPPRDNADHPLDNSPLGVSSVLRKGESDSLI